MIDFIMSNFELLGGILVIAALLIYGIITRQWGLVRMAAYQLMLSAERLMQTSEGKEKFDAVYAALWEQLPTWLKGFAGPDKLRMKLQDWYDIAKDMLRQQATEGIADSERALTYTEPK